MFLAPKARQQGHPPTLLQVKQAFPLPGRYHFRFKSPLVPGGDREKGGLAVWMDCTDDRQPVPVWQSQIVAKVTRIGVEEEEEDDDDDEDFRRPQGTAAVGVPLSQSVPQPPAQPSVRSAPPAQPPAPSFDLFGDGPTSHAPPNPHPPVYSGSGSSMSANLLDTPMPSSGGSSLLDMNYQQHSGPPPHADFLGMTSAPSPPVSGNYGGGGYGGMPQNQPRPPQPQQPPRPNSSFGGSLHQGNGGAFGDLAWK